MGYAKHVGRVGALAVALGIGTAIAAPAWADTAGSETETTATSTGPEPTQTPAKHRQKRSSDPTAIGDSTETAPSVGDDEPDEDASDDVDAADASEEPLADDTVEDAVSEKYSEAEPSFDLDDAPTQTSDLTHSTGAQTKTPTTSPADESPTPPREEPESADPDPAPAAVTFARTTTPPPGTPAPAPLVRQPETPIGVIIGGPVALMDIAARAINMLFNPGPSVPGDPPLLLGVLAFVRREIQRTFFNTSPDAVADIATTSEGLPTQITVLGNDIDPDLERGDILTIVDYTQAANGVVALNPDGTFTYTPNAGFSGIDTFTYTVSDDSSAWHVHNLESLLKGTKSTATVSITVDSTANETPYAADDSATTPEDTAVTIDVLTNDSDADADPLIISGVTAPGHGGSVVVVGNTIVYTPTTNFSGSDTFTYTVSDGSWTDTATVTVTVTPVNDAPVAVNDSLTTTEDTPTVLDVLSNDTDPDGDALSIVSVTAPGHGTATVADGKITYTPGADYAGNDSFTYTVSDGEATSSATVTVIVTAIPGGGNQAPLPGTPAFEYTVAPAGGIVSGFVNVSDPDDDILTFELTSGPADEIGTVVVDPETGAWEFKPTAQARFEAWKDTAGRIATFVITASDGQASIPVEVVAPIVTAVNFTSDIFDVVDERLEGQGLAIAADGRIYVTQYLAGDAGGTVTVIKPDGTVDAVIDIASVVPQAIGTAYDVAIGPDGRVYISSEVSDSREGDYEEAVHGAVVVIDPTTGYSVALFAELGQPASGIDVDSAGHVYVGSWTTGTITVLNADGSLTKSIELPEPEGGETGIAGVAVGPDGRIYVTDPWHGTFTVVSSDGSVTDTIDLGGSPWGVEVGPNGAVYVTDPGAGTVTVLDSDGSIARTASLGSESYPSDVTLGPDGSTYALHTAGGSLGRIVVLTPVAVADLFNANPIGVPAPGIPGSPVVAADGTIYQTATSRDTNGGTAVTVTVTTPTGATSFTDAVPGKATGPLVIDAGGTAYQTVTYRDADTGATVTGVIVIPSSGESWFTGYQAGDAAGAVAFGVDGTAYQTLSQLLAGGRYSTTVLAITPDGVTPYTLGGFPGGSGIGVPSGPVAGPDGTLYLTVGDWIIDPATQQAKGHTTTVAILTPTGAHTSTIAGAAGGGVGFAANGAVYQPIYQAPVDPDINVGTAGVAVLVGDGLVPLVGTVDGIPIGSPVLGPDGTLYQTVFSPVFDDDAGTVEYTTTVAIITPTGLTPVLSGVAGIPLGASSESTVLPVVVGPDGTAYQVTQNLDPDSYKSSTTLAVVTAAGDSDITEIAGYVVGTVVVGPDGRAFLTTYDADTDTTRVAVIASSGTVIHTLAGRPGDPRDTAAYTPVEVAPDGTAYQTTGRVDPDAGAYTTQVSVITETGVTTHSTDGFPTGSVVIGPDGTVYQSIGHIAADSGVLSTTITVISLTGITPITHTIPGAPVGPVVFGPDGTIYQAAVETTPDAADASTRVFVIGESPIGPDGATNPLTKAAVSPAAVEANLSDTPPIAGSKSALATGVATATASAADAMSTFAGMVTAIATIPTSTAYPYPSQVVISPDGRRVYTVGITLAGTYQQAITILDTRTNAVTTIPVSSAYPYNAYGLAISPNGRYVYTNGIGAHYGQAAFILDTHTNRVTTIPIDSLYPSAVGVAVSPDGRRVYYSGATVGGDHVLTVLDTTTNTVTTIPVFDGDSGTVYRASEVVVSPNSRYVYTTTTGADLTTAVNVLDTTTNSVTTIPLGEAPGGFGLALSSDGRRAYTMGVGFDGFTALTVLDTDTMGVTTLPVPGLYHSAYDYAVTVSPDDRRVYVTGANMVTVFDTITNDITTVGIASDYDARTGGMAISPDGGRIYITGGSTNGGVGEEGVIILDSAKITILASRKSVMKSVSNLISQFTSYQPVIKTPDYNLSYLLGEFDKDNTDIKSDTIWVDKIEGVDGYTRLVIYMGGVKSFQSDFHGFFGFAGSANAVIQAKLGIIDKNMDKYINQEIEKIRNTGGHAEVMLVGFSKGGMAAQNYAATGKYKNDVTTVITFGSPLVKKASEYQPYQNILHLEVENDYVPRDGGDAGTITFVYANGSWQYKVSTNGVRETFDDDPTDNKTIYIVGTGGADGAGHNKATYLEAAKVYDDNSWRWSQSLAIVDAIDRFFDGNVTHIDMDKGAAGTGRSF